MQATFGNLARVDQDSWQPGQSPNVSQHCWCIQIGYRPRVSDRPFSEAGFLKDHLTLSWQSTVVAFLVSRLSRKESIAFVLSAIKARAVLCPVGHFVPKDKLPNGNVLEAQHSLGINWCSQEQLCLTSTEF